MRVIAHGRPGSVEAAVELFERHDPADLSDAMGVVTQYGVPATGVFDQVAEAWDRYRHIRELPWD